MEVELTDHLGYEPHAEPPGGVGNTRNGTSPKKLITEHGEVDIDAPRDRDSSFAPKIVRKRQRRSSFSARSVNLRGWGRALVSACSVRDTIAKGDPESCAIGLALGGVNVRGDHPSCPGQLELAGRRPR